MKFSGTPIKHEIPPPSLGQHTDEILSTVLHKNTEQIAALKATGIV
jgi:crotonobetainyl-CoA:carnitine CoA-transferase CaiB-like acyl-CoA transferase